MSGAFEAIDVAVVGGGISGLTAAHYLRRAGRRVVVVEASPRVGGCIGSIRSGPYIADMGPQSFTTSAPLADLVHDLGIEASCVTARPVGAKRYIYRHGRLCAVPTSPFAFITTPLLSVSAKWRLLNEPFAPKRSEEGDESVASFVARRTNREWVDAVAGPIVSGIFAGDPERLSVQSAFPALVQFERDSGSVLLGALKSIRPTRRPDVVFRASGASSDVVPERSSGSRALVGFTGGNQTLINALSRDLAGIAYTGARVTSIRLRGAGFTLECEGLPERTIDARRVIIATPASAAAQLLAPVEPGAAEDLRGVEYVPVAQIALAYPRESIGVSLNGFGFLACRNEDLRILGAVWNSELFADRCPPGEALVTAFLGGATDPAIVVLTDAELARIAHSDLCRAMRIDAEKPRVVAGFRWVEGIPQYTLGHEQRLARIAAAVDRVPGLALLGNYFHGPSVGDCIRQAREAAGAIPTTAP